MVRRQSADADGMAAISILVAESVPARLSAMLEIVREARALAVGARTLEAALVVFEHQDIDLVLVGEGFDHGRALHVPKAAPGRVCILVADAPRELRGDEATWFRGVVARPITCAQVEATIAGLK